ncbi:GntR family transcriptional regulator [Lactococcus hodotermopsidis]|uniref:GntR family transcriptional regulator n=1 Tax=Pseudolactococcus hodotermopsidis TaxID=2709157 RepID=A0A6A0BFL2_9LACT|nr:GntR family transcriptional regulator [Lactococcus hodotermopsidis]GFH43138.1 GntR family transcriptional regulator [Lactococcus hodotermopsidis]
MSQRNQTLYQKVYNSLKTDLINSKYKAGSLFPTENDLMATFDVSKITVRKAVDLLVEAGYLYKQSGMGTKVISNQPINVFNKAKTFTKILTDTGVVVKSSVVYVGKSKDIAINEKFMATNDIYEIHRVYELDDVASIFVKHYFPLENPEILPEKGDAHFSFYSFLVQQGLIIFEIEDAFIARKTPDWLLEAMPNISDIALERVRTAYNVQGNVVEYTISSYDSLKTPYVIDYQV